MGERSEREASWSLRPLPSPISGLVDRSLCSEFQLLTAIIEVCSQGGGVSNADVQGGVRLFVSTAPCVSCLWAIRQFQLLFPRVCLQVGNGEEAYLLTSS